MFLEVAAAEVAFFLHVTNEGLDGRAPPQLSFDSTEDAALLAGDDDAAWLGRIVSAPSLVDMDSFDPASSEALGVLDGGLQGVSAVGTVRQCDSVQNELAARGTGVGGERSRP